MWFEMERSCRDTAEHGVIRATRRNRILIAGIAAWLALAVGEVPLPGIAADAKPGATDQAVVAATSPVQKRLAEDVKLLASDELEGRGVATEGLEKAADYIHQEFAKAGLKVDTIAGQSFQHFSMTTGAELGPNNNLTLMGPGGKTILAKIDTDYVPCSFGGAGTVDIPVVFCGYGINAEDEGYNDFAGVDVKGKAVIIMRRVPQQGNPHGPFANPHGGIGRQADLRSKVSNAYTAGAAAILFVNDPHSIQEKKAESATQFHKLSDQVTPAALAWRKSEDDEAKAAAEQELNKSLDAYEAAARDVGPFDELMEFGYGGSMSARSIPVFHISHAVCNQALEDSLGKSLDQLEAAIDHTLKPATAELTGWKLKATADLTRTKINVKNVIGVLEGTGPLADETIVVGAHYDHLGYGGEGALSPGVKAIQKGAAENASGTACLLELARQLGSRKDKLPRRVVFIAFTGEELGLLGSSEYVKQPIFPLEKTIAMFNMDMVGRMEKDKLQVFGSATAKRWEELLAQLADDFHLALTPKPEGFGPSDHTSFYARQIPVLHVFTGAHPDYHRPAEGWQKLNLAGSEIVVDLMERLVIDTATRPEKPVYVRVAAPATAERNGSRPYFGSIPDFGGEGPGYAISGASPDSPADRAGMKPGDRIIQMGPHKIDTLDDFDLALRKFSAGDTVPVVVVRDGKNITLEVTLAKPR